MRWPVMIVLAGCYQPGAIEPVCVGDDVGLVKETCFEVTSLKPVRVFATDASIDTGDDLTCDQAVPANPDFCFLAGDRIEIDAVVTVRGPRPLVVWSATSIVIGTAGRIDAASHLLEAVTGPGANHPSCQILDGGTSFGATNTGGGGCGGAFGTDGGAGGGGALANSSVVTSACDPQPVALDTLRGGCPGGNGGHATNRGSSGGAVYLMAAADIEVHGRINASGAGAALTPASTTSYPGGGGGGSGGMIAFDAPALNFDGAVLLAVGGGGGSGAGEAAGPRVGNPGKECPSESEGPFFVSGSSQTVNINPGGGNDAAGGRPGGSADATKTGGGGGGGGGHGHIVVFPPEVVPMPPALDVVPPLR